jgi:hypothetical protein
MESNINFGPMTIFSIREHGQKRLHLMQGKRPVKHKTLNSMSITTFSEEAVKRPVAKTVI